MKKTTLDLEVIHQAALTLKAIGHPLRLKIIERLDLAGSMTVTELLKEIPVSQAELSKQLSLLKRRGLVKSSVNRNYRVYCIAFPGVIHLLDCIRKHHTGKGA